MGNYVESWPVTAEGYKPIVDYMHWRVAGLRYADRFDLKNLYRVERHLETDEVFVLLEGKAHLIIADDQAVPTQFQAICMEHNVVYNVKKLVWHHIVTSLDGIVLIVENRDTSAANTEYFELPESMKQDIAQTIRG